MSETSLIASALQLPAGARFFKCALQVNPYSYAGSFRGQNSSGNPAEYVEAIVEKAAELDVSVLAITNHNSVSDVPAFQDAAAGRGIKIFPGFELTSSEGIHILCIYPPDADQGSLERFLGEFGIRRTEPSSDLSSRSFEGVLAQVREQGGIAIGAHATNNKGLLEVLDGKARINAWRNEHLLAIQIPGPIDSLRQTDRKIVENREPDYRRDHAAGEKQAVAVVNAKDIARPDDLNHPAATCWIKMSEVTIEGLRQAFLDPDSRIRLNSDPVPEEHAEVVALAWEGGFLDGVSIHFNSNLNILVGGRGTGKSTVVESLRHVLDLEPIGEEAGKAHQGVVRQVLRSGTKITLQARSYRPAKHEYLIERTIPNPPLVRDENGQISNLLPKDVLPRLEVYGQHEISELTKSPEKLTLLLNRFAQDDELLKRRKADVLHELQKTRSTVLAVSSELDRIEERLSALPSLEETLERFQEAGLEDRLREQSLLVREEGVLDSIPERVRVFREGTETFHQGLPIDRTFLSAKALEELPGKEVLKDANDVLDRLSHDLEDVARQIDEAFKRADEGMDDIRGRWNRRKREVEAAYRKILRELQQSAVDAEEFIRLRREIERLRPLRARRTALRRQQDEDRQRRRSLLAEWEDIKAKEFRALDQASTDVSTRLRNRVQVEMTAAGNREPLFSVLKEQIGGRLSEAIDRLRKASDLSLPDFVNRCRGGAEAVERAYAIPAAQAARLAQASDDALMRIEELELPSTTSIRLNTAGADEPPSWQALDDLSTGQKATAVLLLLLLESDAPLIVDQPEDDLDNRFIAEGVVPRMREEKRRRQFVFSTHNANIPVLGDAELILGLAAAGEADRGRALIAREHMGSIDAKSVRELVEEILEGGKAAFETRRLKYGF